MYGFSDFSHVKESVKNIPLFKANWNKKITFVPWERCCTEKICTYWYPSLCCESRVWKLACRGKPQEYKIKYGALKMWL